MVLCVNTSLKMGKGKIAAQCCHAAMGVIEELLAEDPALWEHYQSCGQPKIALQVKDPAEMHRLAKHAQGLGVLNYIVRDAGRRGSDPVGANAARGEFRIGICWVCVDDADVCGFGGSGRFFFFFREEKAGASGTAACPSPRPPAGAGALRGRSGV